MTEHRIQAIIRTIRLSRPAQAEEVPAAALPVHLIPAEQSTVTGSRMQQAGDSGRQTEPMRQISGDV